MATLDDIDLYGDGLATELNVSQSVSTPVRYLIFYVVTLLFYLVVLLLQFPVSLISNFQTRNSKFYSRHSFIQISNTLARALIPYIPMKIIILHSL